MLSQPRFSVDISKKNDPHSMSIFVEESSRGDTAAITAQMYEYQGSDSNHALIGSSGPFILTDKLSFNAAFAKFNEAAWFSSTIRNLLLEPLRSDVTDSGQ